LSFVGRRAREVRRERRHDALQVLGERRLHLFPWRPASVASAVRDREAREGEHRRPLRQRRHGRFAPLGALTEEHYNGIFDVNVKGTIFTVQKALPLLHDGASIILNASIVATRGFPAFSVYSASKAALRSFARTWSVDLRDRRIRVNAISPGVIPTPAYSGALGMSDAQIDQFVGGSLAGIPLGRPGTPDEIAKGALFLASDDSSYVNGIELFVDGGLAQI